MDGFYRSQNSCWRCRFLKHVVVAKFKKGVSESAIAELTKGPCGTSVNRFRNKGVAVGQRSPAPDRCAENGEYEEYRTGAPNGRRSQ